MLAIPTTKCLGGLGDTSALLKHLVCEHSCENRLVVADITRLKFLRNAAVNVTEPSEQGQQALLDYSQQLVRFLPKLVGVDGKFQMNFMWTDAFGSSLTGTSNTFYFDLACCVWNIGSFESLFGARLDRSNENAIRAACHRFQRAAGCFDFIITDILPKLPPGGISNFPCLSEEGLRMAREMMLSQAQLCFYERAVQDMKKGTMKQSIVAKLAKQTSVYYYSTASACKAPYLANVLDSLWLSVAEFQSKCFEGAAEYWQAQACRRNADAKNKGHGEDVARYKNAELFVTQALENAERSNLTGPLPSSVGTFLQAIRSNQAAAEQHLLSLNIPAPEIALPLREIAAVSMVVSAVTRSLTLLQDCASPLFDFFDPAAVGPSAPKPPVPAPTTATAITATDHTKLEPEGAKLKPTAGVRQATAKTATTATAAATADPVVGQKRPLPTESPASSKSGSGSGSSGPSDGTLGSERTISTLSPPKPASASAGPPGAAAGVTAMYGYMPSVAAVGALPSPQLQGLPGQQSHQGLQSVQHLSQQPHPSHQPHQQPMYGSAAYPPPVMYTHSAHTGPSALAPHGAPLSSAPPAQHAHGPAQGAAAMPPVPMPMHPLAQALSASAHPITGMPVWFYALDFLGIPPQYPLYRFTESTFSIVSGGVLHEATNFNYERATRRLRCHVFIWDFDIVFAADMSCIESGVCLQHSDRARGIPRDFWTYQSTTDIDNNKLHIVRCGPNGQQL